MNRWISRLKDIDLQRRANAVVARQADNDLGRCWTQWRNRLIKNRTERWARDMSSREKQFCAERDERLLHAAFTVSISTFSPFAVTKADMQLKIWRDETIDKALSRRADEHFSNRQKREIMANWSYRAEQKHRLEEQERDLAGRIRVARLRMTFSAWRQRLGLEHAEQLHIQFRDKKLVRHSWDKWRAATYVQSTPDRPRCRS